MQYVMIPVHYFSRKWECIYVIGACTPDEPHVNCGYTYSTSMTESLLQSMKSYSDEHPLKFWNKD